MEMATRRLVSGRGNGRCGASDGEKSRSQQYHQYQNNHTRNSKQNVDQLTLLTAFYFA